MRWDGAPKTDVWPLFVCLNHSSLQALEGPHGLDEEVYPQHSTSALPECGQIASVSGALIQFSSLGESSQPGLQPPPLACILWTEI